MPGKAITMAIRHWCAWCVPMRLVWIEPSMNDHETHGICHDCDDRIRRENGLSPAKDRGANRACDQAEHVERR